MLFQLIFLTEEAEREGEATTPVNSSTQFFFLSITFFIIAEYPEVENEEAETAKSIYASGYDA